MSARHPGPPPEARRAAASATARATLALALVALAAPGCWLRFRDPIREPPPLVYDEAGFARKPMATHRVPLGDDGRPAATVIGRVGSWRIRAGDTLLDVARYHDLGYNEIVQANPGVDPWLPPVGSRVILPTEWVLPCCTYQGLVVNLPEMRLYFYRPAPDDPGTLLVDTYPVGLGRDDRPTPRGRFTVWRKTVDPRWNIPASIQREHIAEHGDRRTFIPGGDPENPLGRYRLSLTIPRYAIHGTNKPWGVGRMVSHGCVRLYPEDIARLFPRVPLGTTGELTYQPVKAGRAGGDVFVEVHPDIYRKGPPPERAAAAALERGGVAHLVDPTLLSAALANSRGLPYRVTAALGAGARTAAR